MLPGVAQLPDPAIAKEIGEAGQRRQRGHDETGSEQPQGAPGEEGVVGFQEGEVSRQRSDKESHRKWDKHRVDRMTRDLHCRLWIFQAHGELQPPAPL